MGRVPAMVVVAITLVLSACSASPGPPTPPPVPTLQAPSPSATPVPSSPSGPNSSAQPVVDAALQDATQHLGVSPDQLHVEQADERQWPDSSLGCPQPGLMYSQIVTAGYLIVISSTSGRRLEYHTDARGHVVLCHES